MQAPNPAAPQKVALAERRAQALQLRKQGSSYRKIAETLRGQQGISPKYCETNAHEDVLFELKRLNEQNSEAAAEVKVLELERLDELWQPYFQKACAGDYAALDRCLNLMERRARLCGLDMPTKQDVTGAVAITQDTRRFDAALAKVYGAPAEPVTPTPDSEAIK